MSSTLTKEARSNGNVLSARLCADSGLLDSSLADHNNFNMEHYQNYDGNLIQPQDTPNTPQNLMRNNRYRSMLQTSGNHRNNLPIFGQQQQGGIDLTSSQLFSPLNDQIKLAQVNLLIFSPELIQHGQRDGIQQSIQSQAAYSAQNQYQYGDFEDNSLLCLQGGQFTSNNNPNGSNNHNNNNGNHNQSNNNQILHFQLGNNSYSRASSQRNTPSCPSPHQASLFGNSKTPFELRSIQGNNVSQTNNLFHQTRYGDQQGSSLPNPNQSPYGMNQMAYDQYNFDLFEDMKLRDWADSDAVKEEDERSQSFMSSQASKKQQKIDDKYELGNSRNYKAMDGYKNNNGYTNGNNYSAQYNDLINEEVNSCTQEDYRKQSAQSYREVKQNDKYSKLSTEKTRKQQFYISPENNEKVTPLKNRRFENNFNYTTPSTIASRHKVKEEEFSDELVIHQSALLSQSRNSAKEEKGGRNGLRILSEKVRDIVCDFKETTYKQVAEYLIKEMEGKKNNHSEFVNAQQIICKLQSPISYAHRLLEKAKDEQNVKRRVYDALNVLIAANVLSKDGKKVKADHALPKGNASSQNPHQKKEYLEKALLSKRKRFERKQETMEDLIKKFVALRSICERNQYFEKQMNRGELPNFNPSNSQLKCISQKNDIEKGFQKLPFPIIGVYSPSNNSKISFKKFNDSMLISSVQPFNLQGDIDILVKLYSYRSQHMFKDHMQKFLDPKLVSFLKNLNMRDSIYIDNSMSQLQMEITITNNKHVEQHLPSVSAPSSASSKYNENYHTQNNNHLNQLNDTSDTSSETVNRIKPNQSKHVTQVQEYMTSVQEYEDSNQLINAYID